MQLVIGDKNLSTWSLRPWLVLKRSGAAFDEILIRLKRPDAEAQIRAHSPSGMIPALKVDGALIWDSLAIAMHVADRYPAAQLWPADALARGQAYAAACEMHSGFSGLRAAYVMDLQRPWAREAAAPSEAAAKDLRRLVALWGDLRRRFGAEGPYLFGLWSIPDAFFTPVAARLRTHAIDLAAFGDDGTAKAYAEALLAQPDFQAWEEAARAE